MNKRAFLEGFLTASTVAFGGHFMWRRMTERGPAVVDRGQFGQLPVPDADGLESPLPGFEFSPIDIEPSLPAEGLPAPAPSLEAKSLQAESLQDESLQDESEIEIPQLSEQQVADYLMKIRNFDAVFASDLYLDPGYETLLLKTTQHLARVESYMGHGNFNLLSFDDMLQAGRNFSSIGEFQSDELNFLEEVFFANPSRYGFFGKKINADITDAIAVNEVAKIDNTGHFLFKGESLNLYSQIKRDVGDSVILTSGVRGVVKQIHLFLAKTVEAQGNLSRASRSLAPPGHSYHGIGDFDVGKIGLGARNFTADFSTTEEYRKISGLGYVDIRYPTDNLFGVRFEPWHIKMS